MFSIISNKLTYGDVRTSVENARQTRPFEIVNTGSSSNIELNSGYTGNTILKDSYKFTNRLLDDVPIKPGDRILLIGQTNTIENGIWDIISIIDGYTNIQRPDDYAKNTPIRSGQYVLIIQGHTLSGKIFKNITPEYDSNGNKIIEYNGTSKQNWEDYKYISVNILKPTDKVIFYSNPFYQAYSVAKSVGEYGYFPNYPELAPFFDYSSRIKSIEIPIGYKVEVYTGNYFVGSTWTFYSSVPKLADYIGNEIIDSFKISSG